MSTLERLVPPSPRARFAFWGIAAELVLPHGVAEVRFEYFDETPHGDPTYRVTVNGATVGGSKPVAFFGRDIHLSDCARFLALTSGTHDRSAFHVLDLARASLWSRPGFVLLEGVSPTAVCFRRYVPDGLNVKPGDLETAVF